jgi:hypothetical protein
MREHRNADRSLRFIEPTICVLICCRLQLLLAFARIECFASIDRQSK